MPATARRTSAPRTRLAVVQEHPSVSGEAPGPTPKDYADCRALGHAWKHRKQPIGIDEQHRFRRPWSAETGMIGYVSTCSQCKAHRVKWLTRSGEIVNRYEYPEGYQQTGDDVMSPRAWRTSFVASLFDAWDHVGVEVEDGAS